MLNGLRFATFLGGLAVYAAALTIVAVGQEQTKRVDVRLDIPFPPFFEQPVVPKPDQIERPCEQGQDDRSSDLCAQWKAADAAQLSAFWTEQTYWLGLGGVGVGLLTLFSAFAAAIYAGRAAIAAEHTAVDAKRIGEAQLRAYMLPRNIVVDYRDQQFHSSGEIYNCGQTPALKVKSWHAVCFGESFLGEWENEPQHYSESDVSAGAPIKVRASGPFPPNPYNFTEIQLRRMKAWVSGLVTYEDVFGVGHQTRYRYEVVIEADGTILSYLSNSGNTSF